MAPSQAVNENEQYCKKYDFQDVINDLEYRE